MIPVTSRPKSIDGLVCLLQNYMKYKFWYYKIMFMTSCKFQTRKNHEILKVNMCSRLVGIILLFIYFFNVYNIIDNGLHVLFIIWILVVLRKG